VPNRLNYILWIQSLLDTTSSSYSDVYDVKREVLGLDIGTGASCIYPLLGCSQRPKWRFAGTDIDEKSLHFARANVQFNEFQSRIQLLQTQPEDTLLPLDKMGFENIDFSMCNPPFYKSREEMLTSAASKQRAPFTACTGSENEMVTTGGEVVFVSRMIDESSILRDRVQWYTSMLGKFSSIAPLITRLREYNIDNYAVTEFVQGSKTRRWGIGWSFEDLRPCMAAARGCGSLQKAILPFPSDYLIQSNSNSSKIAACLNEILSQLPLKWMWKPSISTGVGFVDKAQAVWSRAARRQAKTQMDNMNEEEDEQEEPSFGFKILVEEVAGGIAGSRIVIRWLKGHDSVLFESFCGMMKRKIEESMK